MPVALLDRLAEIVGPAQVLTGPDCARWAVDWTGKYAAQPLAVVRPASTAEVSGILRLAHETATPVVPVSGHTGLTGGGAAGGALVLSLDRMSAITEINAAARTATVEAGVILSRLHDAAAAQDLVFPVTFGARGSAMIGGILGTNAGGSNVVRYGNTRDLCLGLEAVLADGRVVNLMSALHKDNSGYNLRHLLIGVRGHAGGHHPRGAQAGRPAARLCHGDRGGAVAARCAGPAQPAARCHQWRGRGLRADAAQLHRRGICRWSKGPGHPLPSPMTSPC